jgi:hypothetical protein
MLFARITYVMFRSRTAAFCVLVAHPITSLAVRACVYLRCTEHEPALLPCRKNVNPHFCVPNAVYIQQKFKKSSYFRGDLLNEKLIVKTGPDRQPMVIALDATAEHDGRYSDGSQSTF